MPFYNFISFLKWIFLGHLFSTYWCTSCFLTAVAGRPWASPWTAWASLFLLSEMGQTMQWPCRGPTSSVWNTAFKVLGRCLPWLWLSFPYSRGSAACTVIVVTGGNGSFFSVSTISEKGCGSYPLHRGCIFSRSYFLMRITESEGQSGSDLPSRNLLPHTCLCL